MVRRRRDVSRDRDFEWRILASTVRAAASRFGVDCTPYAEAVMRRLRLGAERYGDSAFLGHGIERLVDELLEEPADIAGWSLLTLHALGARAADPSIREPLLEAMVHGAAADFYARQARRALAGSEPA